MFIQIDSNTLQVVAILTDSSGVDISNYIEVTDEQSVTLINQQMMAIDPLTRLYYDTKKKVLTRKVSIDALKEYKINELSTACMNECESGYMSTALGEEYLYPSKVLDQQNLLSTYVACQLDKTGVFPVLCAKSDGSDWKMRDHTADQVITVVNACTVMTSTNRAKYNTLRAKVESATTQVIIEAIKW